MKIGGGAPVVVQSMTLTKTHDVEATTAQIAALASRRLRDRARRRPEDRGRRRAAADREALAAPGDRRHPLQREPRAEGDRRRRRRGAHQPGQHRRPRQGRGGRRRAAKAKGIPMRIGANAGSLPEHLHELARQDTAEALVEAALEQVRAARDGSTTATSRSASSRHVPTMIRAYRMLVREGAVPAAPRRHRGGDAVLGLDQVRRRDGRAARGRDRRHDPRLAHRRPGRGGQDRVRDPQGARPARARADHDRVPELRPRQRRRREPRARRRGAARRRTRRRSRSR